MTNNRFKIRFSTIIWICLLIAAGISFTYIYYNYNPNDAVFMPKCLFHELTGYKCVGCGFQRAVYFALHGNFAEAFRMNAFLVIGLPLIVLYAFADFTRKSLPRFYGFMNGRLMLSAVFVLTIGWWIGRNILGI